MDAREEEIMAAEECPKCHKMTLRVVNVMNTTHTVHLACKNCCHKVKRPYEEENHGSKKERNN
jgi:hypothetical protein